MIIQVDSLQGLTIDTTAKTVHNPKFQR